MHSWETKWKSPIFLFQKPEMIQTVEETNNFLREIIDAEMDRRENLIVHLIAEDTGIIVDKEELVKLLRNDRCQYEKGYYEGKKDALRWIPVSEELPEQGEEVLVYSEEGRVFLARMYGTIWINTDGTYRYIHPQAWMSLPGPYRRDDG